MEDLEKKIRNLEIDRDHDHQRTLILFGVGLTVGYFIGTKFYAPAVTAIVIYLLFTWSVQRKKAAAPND